MTDNLNDKVFPASTAARALHVKPAWLREQAQAGRIPHVKAGDTFLFHLPTVRKILVERAKTEGVSD